MSFPQRIVTIAVAAGIDVETLIPYGHYVAKVPLRSANGTAPLVMVTAITPTPLGEGKTTTVIGLAQGLARLGHRPIATLRQPSLGPTFGIKGGAAGAGRSQVVPAEQLNLHLTGDFHAITAAHNLLAAMVDNHLHHGNELDIDPHSIGWTRVLDVNDRALRSIVVGLGRKIDGVPRQASFDITAASELMTVMALASSQTDLRERLGRVVVAYTRSGVPVTAEDLRAGGALAALLRDSLLPNLMQTTEGVPVLVHTGPFGNIAIGNSSVVADLVASNLGDIVVTESGFGADLGAERMVNLKSRVSGYAPSAAVVVVTVRSLKAFAGVHRIAPGKPLPEAILDENPAEVAAGLGNLAHHLRIVEQWGIPAVVAINAFPEDFDSEHQVIAQFCAERGARCAVTTHVADGGAGAEELAREVIAAVAQPCAISRDYSPEQSLIEKINAVATRVYGAAGIDLAPAACKELERLTRLGFGGFDVVVAKTHLHTAHAAGVEDDWLLPVREVRLAAGAGYVYALTGTLSTMPGLPSHPNAEQIDVVDGEIVGLT